MPISDAVAQAKLEAEVAGKGAEEAKADASGVHLIARPVDRLVLAGHQPTRASELARAGA
jgi:hypothetical protein